VRTITLYDRHKRRGGDRREVSTRGLSYSGGNSWNFLLILVVFIAFKLLQMVTLRTGAHTMTKTENLEIAVKAASSGQKK